MRIGIDARLLNYQSGGISQYTRQLINALARIDRDNEYRLLQMRRHQEEISPALNFLRAPCWTPAHHRLERLALSVEASLLGLDVLHSTDFIPPAGGYRRGIITVHDLNFLHFPELLTSDSRRYYVDQIKWAVGRADRIIAVSEATRRDLLERLPVPEKKVVVIYEAAAAEFRPLPADQVAAAIARFQLAPGYLLFVGTFEPRKNLPTLLEAYARLRGRVDDLPPLVFAGRKGWLFQEIFTTVARLDLARAVRFVERPRPEDLPALYCGASLLAMPSRYEGFGLPVLEAMQCGTPVVASNRAALPEVLGDAGVLVDPQDPAGIAGALERVLSDFALRADLRARGLARAARFSWARAARETLEQYRLLAA